ncbi:putative metalloprotease CJM1_0395 family protein [Thalassobaculum sp.]|uniref:putative metalloprotease CJM1_0395 family protein n=1 Tax=Thalassobaculum sp. TaxID=2022740 RepID=UPI0032EF9150
MTSVSQIVGGGVGSTAGFGQPGTFGRPSTREDETDRTTLPGRRDPREATEARETADRQRPGAGIPELPGRRTDRQATDVARLPGQEGVDGSGPRRPLIAGGAFVLAVAIGLSLDEQSQPEGIEPATPVSTGSPAAAEGDGPEELGANGLTEAEQEQVRELQQRDAEVRQHEAAHAAAGGQYAGSPTYTYQTGPDGRQYAVGGEVSIDTSPVRGNPEATIQKAQQIKAAASAPADPSSQDRRVAAQADALRQQAQAELQAERAEARQGVDGDGGETEPSAAAAAQQPASAQGAPDQGPDVQSAPQATSAPAAGPQGSAEDREAGLERTASPDAFGASVGPDDEDAEGGSDRAFIAPVVFSGAAASYRHTGFKPNQISISV